MRSTSPCPLGLPHRSAEFSTIDPVLGRTDHVIVNFPPSADIERIGRETGWAGRQVVAAALVLVQHPLTGLDVGAMDGWLVRYLQRLGIAAIGVDLSPTSRDVLKADARRLPFLTGSVSVVAPLDVIEHLPRGEEYRAISEAKRVMQIGGTLVISTPADWRIGTLTDVAWWLRGHRHYSAVQLRTMVETCGLDVVALETRGGWSEVLGLPILYLFSRLGRRVPFSEITKKWGWREYSRPGRYTHFLVARPRDDSGSTQLPYP
jgi:SAM-dependent methyltransferase